MQTKNKKRIIKLYLVFYISTYFLAFIPRPAYAVVPLVLVASQSLKTAFQTAIKNSALIQKANTAAFSAVESGKVGMALKGAGIFAAASAASVLVMEGVSQSSGEDGTLATVERGYSPASNDMSCGEPDLLLAGNYHIIQVYYNLHYLSTGFDPVLYPQNLCSSPVTRTTETVDGQSGNSNASEFSCTTYTESGAISKFNANPTYPFCQFLGSEPDFSNPTEKEVSLSSDANGDFYNDSQGNRVPVYTPTVQDLEDAYQAETGTDYDFKNNFWDSVQNKPDEYLGLNYQDATDRANYLSNSSDVDYLLNNDVLPESESFETSNIETVKGNPTLAVVNHYDENGNYSHTTTDTYQGTATYDNGVLIGTGSTYLGRTSTVDSSLVGTTSTANSSSLSGSTTYSGSDAVTNSKISEDVLSNNSTADSGDKLLKKILSQQKAITSNTSAIANVLSTPPDLPPPPDLTGHENQLVTDFDADATAFVRDETAIDLDSFTYQSNLFPDSPCSNLNFQIMGTGFTVNLLQMCIIWQLFGTFLVGFSYLWGFEIVYAAVKG